MSVRHLHALLADEPMSVAAYSAGAGCGTARVTCSTRGWPPYRSPRSPRATKAAMARERPTSAHATAIDNNAHPAAAVTRSAGYGTADAAARPHALRVRGGCFSHNVQRRPSCRQTSATLLEQARSADPPFDAVVVAEFERARRRPRPGRRRRAAWSRWSCAPASGPRRAGHGGPRAGWKARSPRTHADELARCAIAARRNSTDAYRPPAALGAGGPTRR